MLLRTSISRAFGRSNAYPTEVTRSAMQVGFSPWIVHRTFTSWPLQNRPTHSSAVLSSTSLPRRRRLTRPLGSTAGTCEVRRSFPTALLIVLLLDVVQQ